jgi:hypothetical protein
MKPQQITLLVLLQHSDKALRRHIAQAKEPLQATLRR